MPYILTPGDLQGGQERLLQAFIGVVAIAEEPVGRLPHHLRVSAEDFLPVRRHASLRWLELSAQEVVEEDGFLTEGRRRKHRFRLQTSSGRAVPRPSSPSGPGSWPSGLE